MIALDYAPASHGHYLEYVINRYIFDAVKNLQNIFTDTGSSHNIQFDKEYNNSSIIKIGHYSSLGEPLPRSYDQMIIVNHDVSLDFILLCNSFFRCYGPLRPDSSVDEVTGIHLAQLGKDLSDVDKRNNWYNKLQERNGFLKMTNNRNHYNVPVFDFDYSSIFNLVSFCDELSRLSKFLNNTFSPDSTLATLHTNFLLKNQGWQLYTESNNILECILSDTECNIPDNWMIHSYLNYKLSSIYRIYDGDLFEGTYPTSTKQVHEILTHFIDDFDNRFE